VITLVKLFGDYITFKSRSRKISVKDFWSYHIVILNMGF